MANNDLPVYPTVPARRVDREGFSIREDVLYSDAKGRERKKIRKLAGAALDSLGDVLRRVLEPGETIFYTAAAQAVPGPLTQFFGGGWHTYSLPRTAFFITDRRIIALRLRKRITGWNWNRGIQTARWGDVAGVKATGGLSRRLTLTFRNGETRRYWRFAWGDAKKLALLIEALRAHASGETSSAGGLVSLCPNCLAALASRQYRCAVCGVEFKDEKTLWQRGLMIPGGASLYVGASGLGMFRGVFEGLITLGIIYSLVRLLGASGNPALQGRIMTGIVFECFILFLDKLLAYYLALPQVRDFIPVD
jgi:hypothetical protein